MGEDRLNFFVLNQHPIGGRADTEAETVEQGSRVEARKCPTCHGTISLLEWLPPFQVRLTRHGQEFGDFVFDVGDDFLVSQRFLEAYRASDLRGLAGFEPVEVVKVKSRRRTRPEPPVYFAQWSAEVEQPSTSSVRNSNGLSRRRARIVVAV